MAGTMFLQHWLVFVGLLRLLSVYLGFFNFQKFQSYLFDLAPHQVTPLYGRTFGIWTLLSCSLCLICARNPSNRPVYTATLVSFVLAILHFTTEVTVYHTMSWRRAATPLFVAGFSTLWMGFGWNYYTIYEALENNSKNE